MAILYKNNAASTLASSITNVATSLTVATGHGTRFPAITGSDYFYVTIISASDPTVFEIVKCTARSGDVLTIVRAQESTTAAAWSANDRVEQRITAAMLSDALGERALVGGSNATGTWGISISGSAATLTTGRTIGMTGDVTWTSASFNGSGNVTGTATLANSGVGAGTYTKVTVDAKGRVTTGASLAAGDVPTLDYMLRSSSAQTDPNVVFSSSAYRFDPNANNPTNHHYAVVTYGNQSNVVGQLATHFTSGQTFTRAYNTAWSAWRTLLDSSNFNSYSPTLTGTGASGTWGISVTGSSASTTGNAATATTLQTARTINGTSFNGSANITTASWGTARTLTIGATGKSVDGSGNVSWTLGEIGAVGSGNTMTINAEYSGTVAQNQTGWYTIASYGSGRAEATFHLSDQDSSRHNYVRANIVWSYGYGGIVVDTSGRHGVSTIRNIRLLYSTSDRTYGGVKVQVYCEGTGDQAWTLRVRQETSTTSGWGNFTEVTPVLEGTPAGWAEGYQAYYVNEQGQISTSSSSAYFAGNLALHSGNYGSYALPLSGGVLTGQLTLGSANQIVLRDEANANRGFIKSKQNTGNGIAGLVIATSGGEDIVFKDGDADTGAINFVIKGSGALLSGGSDQLLHASNYSSYALPLSGGTLTGTLTGTTGRFQKNQTAGNYTTAAIWTESYGNTTTGVAFHISGNVGKFLEMRTDGILYWNGDTVVHSGNYSSWALPITGGTMTGQLNIGTGTKLAFGSQTRQMIDLWGTQYGIGVQSSTTYFRSDSRFSWHRGGSHSDSENNAGGGTVAMTLDSSSFLYPAGGIRAPQITAGGSTNTDVQFGVSGTTHLAGTIYRGGTIGTINSWSSRLTSSSGVETLSLSRLIVDRQGYGSQALIDAQLGSIALGQYTTIESGARVNGGIRQGADLAQPLASWSAGGTSSGMVIFSFPGGSGNYGMVHCVFDIYEYDSPHVSTVIVGGHNWNGSWYNSGANVVGQCAKEVRLGFKDGKYCVVFGVAGSSWSYGTIVLRKIHNGGYYTNNMDMGAAFTTAQTTTESFTNISGDLRALRTPASFNAGGAITQAGNQVLHAANYNSYAMAGAGYSANQNLTTGSSPTFADIYMNGWFRNNSSGQGIYNQATGNHFYSDGGYWNVGYAGTTGIRLRNGHAGTVLGVLYAETSGNFGLLDQNGNWAVRVYPGSNGGGLLYNQWQASGGFRTNRWMDYDGNFLFRQGINTGATRHLNLADTESDPSVATGTGISWGQRTDGNPYYLIYTRKYDRGGGLGDYTRLQLSWHTGIDIGATYGGTRFYNNSPWLGSEIFSVGNGDSNVRVVNTLYSYAYRGNGNVAGTGEAIYAPAGVYSTGTNWLYGTIYTNGNQIFTSGGTVNCGAVSATGQVYINNGDPTIYLQDSSHRSSMIHCNSNVFYILRGTGTNSTGWGTYNGYWPAEWSLETNDATFGGNVTAVYNVTAYSDERLKKNWRSLPESFVERLAGVKNGVYERICVGEEAELTQVGVSAQSLREVLPEAVTEASDEMKTLSVSYGNAALAAAVELAKEIVKLRTELDELKSKLN